MPFLHINYKQHSYDIKENHRFAKKQKKTHCLCSVLKPRFEDLTLLGPLHVKWKLVVSYYELSLTQNSGDYAVLGGSSKIAAMLLTYPFQVN